MLQCYMEETTQVMGHESVLEGTEHRFGISANSLEWGNNV